METIILRIVNAGNFSISRTKTYAWTYKFLQEEIQRFSDKYKERITNHPNPSS